MTIRRLAPAAAGALAVFVVSAGTVLAQDQYPGVDELPEISLRMSDTSPMGSDAGKATEAFVNYVQTSSKGKIKIEVFWASSLMPPMETAEGIGSGMADLASSIFAHFRPSDFPVANWIQIVGVRSQGGAPFGDLVPAGAAIEFFTTDPDVQAEFHSRNIHLLGGSGSNAYDILCTSPVATLADAKGKRTRTGTTTIAKQAAALGMVATPLDITEAYEAFSRGIIDCGNMEISTYMTFGMVDVPRQVYWTPVALTGLFLPGMGMNLDKWNSLPPVAKLIIQDAVAVQIAASVRNKMETIKKFGARVQEGKIKAVVPAEDLQAAATAFNDSVLADMVNTPPAGITDAKATVDRLNALYDKWSKIVADAGVKPVPGDIDGIIASWQTPYDFDAVAKAIATEAAAARKTAQ